MDIPRHTFISIILHRRSHHHLHLQPYRPPPLLRRLCVRGRAATVRRRVSVLPVRDDGGHPCRRGIGRPAGPEGVGRGVAHAADGVRHPLPHRCDRDLLEHHLWHHHRSAAPLVVLWFVFWGIIKRLSPLFFPSLGAGLSCECSHAHRAKKKVWFRWSHRSSFVHSPDKNDRKQ